MKWFFALSESSLNVADQGWKDLIRVAVRSARAHTDLEPHFVYDGLPSAFTSELAGLGVKIVQHRVSFLDRLLAKRAASGFREDPVYNAIAAGAYLRVEIPLIEQAEEFVLYTDCDVLFLRMPDLGDIRPEYFACAPQRYQTDFADMNSGVMMMNLPALRQNVAEISDYIIENFHRLNGFDQPAFREFYRGRFARLPLELNWKPYWGLHPDAAVIHFHGPKPETVRTLLEKPHQPVPPILRELFGENVDSYRAYLAAWDAVRAQPNPTGGG